ncbi:MAG: hypothetical protein K0R15_87 [Clostridiales bacterium]|jgi:hypothetical protein|nr:hypothetical protein [Clostridiales bacterium]
MCKTPGILLLDNSNLSIILSEGEFKLVRIPFEEAKAIIELNHENDIVCCFDNIDIEHIIFTYLGIENRRYAYKRVDELEIGQNAIAFKLYITPSETQPIIRTEEGIEAKKIQNIYVYCQLVTRIN